MAEETTVAKVCNPRGELEFSNACLYRLYHGTRNIPVIKRLYPSLLKTWASLTWTGSYKVKRYRGVSFLLNYRNQIDRKIGLHGGYESKDCAYFLSEMEKGCDVFLDIGASVGVYALQAAHRDLAKEIHAFEPDPRNFAQLTFNIHLNGFTDLIQAHKIAVSSADGTLQFEMSSDTKTIMSQVAAMPDAGASYKMGHMTPGTGMTRQVEAKALDNMLFYQGKKIFIKINIQGHELDALKGATRLLRDNACFVQVWMWPENHDRVMQQFSEMGYKVVHMNQGEHYLNQGYYYLTR